MNALQKRMRVEGLKRDLKAWGNDIHTLDCVRMRSPEQIKHFLVKTCVCMLLRNWDHEFMTEVKTKRGTVMDVFDLSTGLNYEIQSKGQKESYADGGGIIDTVIIPAEKCPNEFLSALHWLEKYLT